MRRVFGRAGRRSDSVPALVLVAFAVACVASNAAALKVSKGTAEHALGLYVGFGNDGTWWTFEKFASGTLPVGSSSASGAVASPTKLPPNVASEFGAGGAGTGNLSWIWTFGLQTSAPTSVELELVFNSSWPGGSAHVVVFVETPSTAPTSMTVVRFALPEPNPTLTSLAVESFEESTATCGSVGTCP